MGDTAVWVSGASSGIGEALLASVPFANARVFGVARRTVPRGESLQLDLADPASWRVLSAHFESVLSDPDVDRGVFVHCAAVRPPADPVAEADLDEYTTAVLLNSAAPQVLGAAFLGAARRGDATAALVLCSSPAAMTPRSTLSHYGAGKAAVEFWADAVSQEDPERASVFAVVPFAVDTPMLREQIATAKPLPPSDQSIELLQDFAKTFAAGGLASASGAAAEIWAAVLSAPRPRERVLIGAVPERLRQEA